MATETGKKIKKRFAVPYACYKLFTKRGSFILDSGWVESIRTSTPCDRAGDPVPWMNYSMVDFVRERLNDSVDVFEFGSGYSTCFFAKYCRSVTSVEYNPGWLARVRAMVPDNARVLQQHEDVDGDYCRSIAGQQRSFDLVVVDGRDRVNCVRQSVDHLTRGGVILLDDTERERYRPAFDFLAGHGFRQLTLSGVKPGTPCRCQTTIFYRDGNCFGI